MKSEPLQPPANVVYCPLINFGDLLNVPTFIHYWGLAGNWALTIMDAPPPNSTVYLGIGTLPELHLRREWFEDKKTIFLGTGTIKFEDKWEGLDFSGFVRGKLSEQKLGVPGLGDLGILIDRIFGRPQQRVERTLFSLDHLLLDWGTIDWQQFPPLPNPKLAIGLVATAINGVSGVYNYIASSRYVITDRVHYAMAAEAAEVPWVIYDHGYGNLPMCPKKFLDWAGTIGKERFIVYDPADIGLVEENTDFEASAKQKDILEKALLEIGERDGLIGK